MRFSYNNGNGAICDLCNDCYNKLLEFIYKM